MHRRCMRRCGRCRLEACSPESALQMEGVFYFSFGWKDMKMIIFKGVRDRFAETTKNNAKNMPGWQEMAVCISLDSASFFL